MRTTAQIVIQKAPRRRRRTIWPLTGTGTALAVSLLILGAALVSLAFTGY